MDLDFGKFTILGYSISPVYLCLVDVLIFDVLIPMPIVANVLMGIGFVNFVPYVVLGGEI